MINFKQRQKTTKFECVPIGALFVHPTDDGVLNLYVKVGEDSAASIEAHEIALDSPHRFDVNDEAILIYQIEVTL